MVYFTTTTTTTDDEGGLLENGRNHEIFLRSRTSKKIRVLCIIGLVLATIIKSASGGGRIPNSTEVKMPIPANGAQNVEVIQTKVICTTKLCNETAKDIQNSMNLKVNPCDNFYDFACSRYKPQKYGAVTAVNRFHETTLKYNRVTEEMFDTLKGQPRPNEHFIIKHARDVYKNCLSAGTRSTDSTYVREFIRKTLNISQWPSQELSDLGTNYLNEKVAEFNLQFFLSPLFTLGTILPAFDAEVIFNIKEPTFNLPMLLRSGDQYSAYRRNVFFSYSSYVAELMNEFGGLNHSSFVDRDNGIDDVDIESYYTLKEMSEEVVWFEQALFHIIKAHTNKTGYEELTLSELDGVANTNNLETIYTQNQNVLSLSLRETMAHILQKTGNSSVQDDDKINIFNSTVFLKIVSLISNTKKEIVVNYLGYRLAQYLVPFSPRLSKLYHDNPYTLATSATTVIPSKSTTASCMDFVQKIFMPAFIRYPGQMTDAQKSMFGENVERNLRDMYTNIKDELIRTLPDNNQLTENRTIRATQDIKNVRFCQDNWLFNQTELEEYYAGILPLKKSYLEQYSSLKSWNSAKYYRMTGKVLSEIDACNMDGPSYNPGSRQINLPPYVWMEPFYEQEWPGYLKYSGIGLHLSHEWTHALFSLVPDWVDNPNANKLSKKFTQKINLSVKEAILEVRNSPFQFTHQLSNMMDKKTFRSSQCIVDHYDEFSIKSIAKEDGIRTFQENFADIGGMKLAYSVYKSKQSGATVEETLPGFQDYSNDQLFFLNYARGWCDTRSVVSWNKKDPHTPSKYRVIGTLRNSEEFKRAWKCPVGSYMNPADKCPVF